MKLFWLSLILVSGHLVADSPPPLTVAAGGSVSSAFTTPEVIFSSRFDRPEAVAVAKEFGATRVDWVYLSPDFAKRLSAARLRFGMTINANQKVPDQALARDLAGQPLVAPWMASWGARWISATHPDSLAALVASCRAGLSAGADRIQFDDPQLGYAALPWGGDCSEAAIAGFERWLAAPEQSGLLTIPSEARQAGFNYRSWLLNRFPGKSLSNLAGQRLTTPLTLAWERYHLEASRQLLARLRDTLPPGTPLSFNLSDPMPDSRTFGFIDLADYLMAEFRPLDAASAWVSAMSVRSAGKAYVPSLTPGDLAATRRQILVLLGLGTRPLVPWDVYLPDQVKPDGTRVAVPRYFGRAAELADIFSWPAQRPDLFANWQPAASLRVIVDTRASQPRNKLIGFAQSLLDQSVAFDLTVVQATFPVRQLAADDLSGRDDVVVWGGLASLSAADQALLSTSRATVTAANSPGQLSSLLSKHRLVATSVPGLVVIPRVRDGSVQYYLVPPLTGPNSLTVQLRVDRPELRGKSSCRWSTPGQSDRRIAIGPDGLVELGGQWSAGILSFDQ